MVTCPDCMGGVFRDYCIHCKGTGKIDYNALYLKRLEALFEAVGESLDSAPAIVREAYNNVIYLEGGK